MSGNGAPRDFDAHLRRVHLQVRDDGFADQFVKTVFLLAHRHDLFGERSDEAVGKKDAEKGSDERAADHLAEHFRRLVDRRHRLDDAEHGRDDAEGGERVGDLLQGMAAMQAFVMHAFKLFFEQVLDLMRVVEIHQDRTDRVADDVGRLVILGDFRIALENRRFRRVFDMGFRLDGAFLGDPQKLVHQAQKILIIAALPFRAGERFHDIAAGLFDHAEIVADEERADRGAADDHDFIGQGMENDPHLAAGDRVSAEHHGERNDDSD